jgi:hypothetical protein
LSPPSGAIARLSESARPRTLPSIGISRTRFADTLLPR